VTSAVTWGRPRVPAVPLLAGAYLVGTVVAATVGGWWVMTLAGGGFAASSAVLIGRWPTGRVAVLVVAVVLASAGHARFAAGSEGSGAGVELPLGEHSVVGVVREDARTRGVTARVDVGIESIDGVEAEGGVRVTLPAPLSPIRAGERLALELELEAPPEIEDFDYATYLGRRDIQAVAAFPERWERVGVVDGGLLDWLPGIRRWATGRIERALPEPESSLAAGVLVGERGAMPSDLTEALRTTGTTHLVVVSGQNIALLLGMAMAVLAVWLPRRQAALVALFGLLIPYVVLVGADAPVVRAAVMSVGIVIASVLGRRTPGWIYLVYAAALMVAWEPLYAVDVAFQLSATATAGVIVVAPALTEQALARFGWAAGGYRGAFVELSATATAATVAVLPVQVAAFERVSLIAVPANVAVAPLYEGSVLVAAVAMLVGAIEPLAVVLRPVLAIVPAAFIWVVRAFAAIPAAEFVVTAPLLAGAGWYAGLGLLVWWLDRRGSAPRVLEYGRRSGLGWSIGLAVVAAGLWLLVLQAPGERARVTVLDVGQGLAVLVEDGGQVVLIDSGPPDGAVVSALPGRIGRLDAIVLTHSDSDHAGGLASLLERVGVGAMLASDRTLADLESEPGVVVAGSSFDIGDVVRVSRRTTIEVLSPPVVTAGRAHESDNDGSLVLLVTIGERRILVTADIEKPAEQWLVASGQALAADVLLVPHHGSKSSSTVTFVEAVDPVVAVISVGGNAYGHPAEEVVARYSEVSLYRTDVDGDVVFTSDGERLWVRGER
jgi:competence protein ComEC